MKKFLRLFPIALLCLLFALLGAACSKEVTLSFETDGGTPLASVTAEAGAEVSLPVPVKAGFAFDGWYTSSDLSGERFEGTISAPEKSTKYFAKWVTGYELRLDPDGGTLAATSLWLKEGANVYNAVEELSPQKSGLLFGAWFLGENELSRSYRMPAESVTLTAKYKVEYIIQVYLQTVGRTSYQRTDALETSGSGYVNTSVTPAPPAVANFTYCPAPEGREPVDTLVLSPDAEQNVYSLYYDRNLYTVVYVGDPPAGGELEGATPYDTVVYGDTVAAKECGFTVEGYRFAGWAERPGGELVYTAGAEIRVTSPILLYAVWDAGYTDRFGGSDLIFFPRTQGDVAILRRNGMEFEGTREGNAFSFTTPAGETFRGVAVGGSFSYEQNDAEGTYYFFDNYRRPSEVEGGEELRFDRTRKLTVDKYLGAVYSEKDAPDVRGVLTFAAESGDYLFTSEDGKTSFHTIFQKGEDPEKNIFAIGGEEFGYYVDSNGEVMVLDGYGTAFLQITLTSGYTYTLRGQYYIEGSGLALNLYDSYKVVCWITDSADVLGLGVGEHEFSLCMLPMYFAPRVEIGLYFFADSSRGTYGNGEETLVLDGHGYYGDSAVYTDADGEVLQGPYSVSSDFVSGSVAELLSADGSEVLLSFRLSADGSFTVYEGPEVPYTEYYLLEGSSMQPVLLAMFEEEYPNVKNSKRVEFYANNSRGVAGHAASGYVTFEKVAPQSDILLYTFVRTEAEYGFSETIPESMRFITTVVQLSNETRYGVYCVLEREGEKGYDTVLLPNGGTVWANSNITVRGDGSLYFLGDNAYYCSFTTYRDPYFGGLYGELFYRLSADAEQGANMLLLLTAGTDVTYTSEEAVGIPTEYYYFDPELSPTEGLLLDLVLCPDGRAAYLEDAGTENWEQGTYRRKGNEVSVFGAPVYELVIGDTSRFSFTLGTVYFLGVEYEYAYFRDVGRGGVYVAEDGGTLLLDGYGAARYTSGSVDLEGSYWFLTESVLRLTVEDGTEYEFELTGEEDFVALDPIYGTWDLVDGNFQPLNGYSRIYFDGKGTYTITANYGTGTHTQGFYALSNAEFGEYVLYQATIDGVTGNYYVRFMEYVEYANYNCVVRDRASGVYVDDHYRVLELNGFGSGSLVGNDIESMGNFYVIDGDLGFGYFLFTTENTAYSDDILHVLLNYEEGTFRILEYGNLLYFASDLDHLAFRDDGSVFLGNLQNGDYLVTEKGVNVYIYDQYNYVYRKQELPAVGGAQYVYGDKTYYRYDESVFRATGTVTLLGGEGEESLPASLSFEARLRGITNFATVFEIDGEEYGGFGLTTYTGGKIDPRVEYNNIVYNIDFTHSGSGWTFTVTDAGVREFTRDDMSIEYYDGTTPSGSVFHQGGRITFTYDGFGGYARSETLYAGRFLYLYDEEKEGNGVIEFKGKKESEIRTVGYHDLGTSFGGYRELKEILFTQNGKQYAVDFFEYVSGSVIYTYSYMLYGLYEYEEVPAGDYTLGVKYLLATTLAGSPGYGVSAMLGKPVSVTLLGENKTPVTAVTLGTRYEGRGVWLVENKNGAAGDAYLISFEYEGDRVVSGRVEKGSVQQVGLSGSYNFYLFINEEGEVGELMAAWYASTAFASVTDISHEGDVWTFTGREDASQPLRRYTLTFTRNATGLFTVTVQTEIIGE